MTRKDLILRLSDATGHKQALVREILEKSFDLILEALLRGEKVELRNFGIFKVKTRRQRIGRNPKTGVTVPIPPHKVVTFRAGLEMEQKIK